MEVSIKRPLFGKEVEIVIKDMDSEIAGPILERTYRLGLRLSAIFNFHDQRSELANLNKKRTLRVSEELLDVIHLSLAMARQTNGQYDVSLGKVFKQRKAGEKESAVRCSYRDIKTDGHRVSLTHPDALLDLSSIAKGYIVDKMIEHLKEEGVLSGLIDGRGDIRVFGDHEEVLSIEHPRQKGSMIARLRLKDEAVATSGDYNQYIGTHQTSHIINAKDAISVTVVAPTLMLADLNATAIFVLQSDERDAFIAKEHIKAYIIDKDLRVHQYNKIEEALIT
ncbi:MAG: FAD:protein FMN transferase [Nanoarchaeota archaeon]